MKKGIDVSEWNGGLDYTTLSKNIDFVIIREGYRQKQDFLFKTHVAGFRAAKVPIIGVYHFIYATDNQSVKREAESCIKHVEAAGLPKTTRIWCDFEYDTVQKAKEQGVTLGKAECNLFSKTFCEAIKAAGYPTGIYTNEDYAANMYDADTLRKYPVWYAHYFNKKPARECMIWQYSCKGKVPGSDASLDMDYLMVEKVEELTTVEKATRWMEDLAADPTHGYDQQYRWGEKGDYDCSSAVITAYRQAGVPLTCTYTGNMREDMLKKGFKDVTSKVNLTTGSGLKRGDVLLNTIHHTAMYCGNGMEVEASINELGRATGGKPGDQTGREILVRAYRNYPWNYVLRYESVEEGEYMFAVQLVKKGSESASVKLLQRLLRGMNYKDSEKKSLVVDGQAGDKTIYALTAFQKKNGLEADGVCGSKTWAKILGV